MPTINQLASTNTITGSDQFPVYVSGNGDARKASASTLLAYIQSAWMDPAFTRITASPTLAGFTLALPATANSLFVLLTPTGVMATGTITLPASSTAADGQEVVIYTSQEVTVCTFALNGATAINGAPVGLLGASAVTLRYDAPSASWFTIEKPVSAGSGTAGYLAKWVSPSAVGNSIFRDNGTNAALGGPETGDRFTVHGTIQAKDTDQSVGVNVINTSSTAARYPGFRAWNYTGAFPNTPPVVQVSVARGTYNAPLPVQSGDDIGIFTAWAHDGADFFQGAGILVRAQSNWAAARSASMTFSTSNAGTVGSRLYISPTGNVQLATNSTVFDASGAGQGLRLSGAGTNPDPNALDTYEEGTFTPVYNGTGIVGTVTFSGRYQRTGNQVTMDITITTGAASSLSFTSATDYFDNFPAITVPAATNQVGGLPVGDSWILYLLKIAGTFRAVFQKSGSPVFSLGANTSIRYNLPTYLV